MDKNLIPGSTLALSNAFIWQTTKTLANSGTAHLSVRPSKIKKQSLLSAQMVKECVILQANEGCWQKATNSMKNFTVLSTLD